MEFVNQLNDGLEEDNSFELDNYYAITMRKYYLKDGKWKSRLTIAMRENKHTKQQEPNIMRNREDAEYRRDYMQQRHDEKRKSEGKKRNIIYGVHKLVELKD